MLKKMSLVAVLAIAGAMVTMPMRGDAQPSDEPFTEFIPVNKITYVSDGGTFFEHKGKWYKAVDANPDQGHDAIKGWLRVETVDTKGAKQEIKPILLGDDIPPSPEEAEAVNELTSSDQRIQVMTPPEE